MMNRKSAFWATTALMTSLAMASAVHAQETTGGIAGTIRDASGAPVSGASVTITHAPSGTTTTTVTGAGGGFNARNLRVGGPYIVEATSSSGSASADVASIGIGSPYALDLTVESAADASATDLGEIVVTAARGTTVPGRTRIGQVDIETLPSISRDIKDFVRTSPFATIDPTNSDALLLGGQSNRANAFLVDGIRQGDDFGLQNNGYPTQNSPISISVLEAVSVDVAPYDVQYGSFSGGVVNSVTKSGGNEFAGELFYEQTNDDMRGDSYSFKDFVTGQRVDRSVTNEFEETTWGATFSGPILRDRLFFLLNYEKFEGTEPVLTGPQGSGSAAEVPGITQANIDQIRQITQSVYGYDPLDWQASELLTQDEKYFAKLDWNINDRHRAVFSYQQTEGNRLTLGSSSTSASTPVVALLSQAYSLQSNLYAYKAQLFSDWTDNFSTELSVSRKEVENISNPLAGDQYAAFRVYLDPVGTAQRRSILLGTERSRHANVLTNDLDQIRLVARYDGGDYRLMVGAERETVEVYNAFVQAGNGEYEFASVADYQNRIASYINYSNAASNNKADGGASFSYTTNSVFLQQEIDLTSELTVRAGLRLDAYEMSDRPLYNPAFQTRYGFRNDETLDGAMILQPRVNFTWRPDDTLTVYGGFGLFQGGSPNVWISNNFTNTGNLIGSFACRRTGFLGVGAGSSTPVCGDLSVVTNVSATDVATAAETANTASANTGLGAVNVIDPNFEPPSIWKASIGFSKTFDELPWIGDAWTVRGEYVHSEVNKGINWIDLDLRDRQTTTAPDGRPRYTGPTRGTSGATLMLTNSEGGYADQATLGVSKDWNDGWLKGVSFDLSHTYTDSTDVSPGTSSVAASNFGQVAAWDPNALEVATSNYEIRHATKLSLSYRRNFFGDYRTSINLFAQRRSGLPFSHTFSTQGLVGEPSLYDQRRRQLLYVPSVDSSGAVTATSDPIVRYANGFDFAGFNSFLQNTGLIQYAGQISPRNAFRSPAITTVDIRIAQELPAFFPNGARLEAYLDIENLGNLLNDEWGTVQQIAFPYFSQGVTARNCQTATGAGTGATQCVAGIGNFYQFDSFRDWTPNSYNQSVWQMKLGVRYKF